MYTATDPYVYKGVQKSSIKRRRFFRAWAIQCLKAIPICLLLAIPLAFVISGAI